MTYTLDHVVIVVYDLARAVADYAAMGFTVVEGGEHADGLTHNALVAFQDGSYLELIAFRSAPPEEHPFYRTHGREGLVTFALLPGDIEAAVREAQEEGLKLNGPRRGGRNRLDGVSTEWQTAWAETRDLPFLCADVTSRDLRVPFGTGRLHANGIAGTAGLTVVVHDLETSTSRYRALLGSAPLPHGPYANMSTAAFAVGGTVLVLVQPEEGPLCEYLEARGEGPCALSLLAGEGRPLESLPPDLAHGVDLEVVPQGSEDLGTLL